MVLQVSQEAKKPTDHFMSLPKMNHPKDIEAPDLTNLDMVSVQV